MFRVGRKSIGKITKLPEREVFTAEVEEMPLRKEQAIES